MSAQIGLKLHDLIFYDQVFRTVDPTGTGNGPLPSAAVRELFLRSRLGKALAAIWTLSDRSKAGALSRDDFYIAMRLIALAQNGHPTPAFETMLKVRDVPLPQFVGIQPSLTALTSLTPAAAPGAPSLT